MICKLRIIILLVIVLIVCQSVMAKDNSRINKDLLIEVYKSTEKHFIGEINRKELLNGSLNGIKSFLKEKNISADIKDIDITDNEEADLKLFASRINEITSTYASKELPEEDILREGIDGMLKALNDPYSYYMDPEEYKDFVTSINMLDYSGIGLYLELDKKNDNKLIIVEVIDGSPAYKAGLKSGDEIVKINGHNIKTVDEAVKEIRGPEGTSVVISIKKDKEDPKDISIVRGVIHVDNVSESLIDKKIGYIKIRSFGARTSADLEEAMAKLKEAGVKAYILDLRNNGGGYVESAVSICSQFLPEKATIVTVKEKEGFPLTYKSETSIHSDLPLVILVNEYSASAAEITAGAIQDNKRGVLIGTKTFGKGCVQTLYPLGISGVLKITTALYYTPLNKSIDKTGLTPDIEVDMDKIIKKENDDLQLQKAIDFILNKT